MFGVVDICTSALVAQRANIDVIAGNIANRESYTRDAAGDAVPYRRRVALFAPGSSDGGPGVRVAAVAEDPSPFGLRWAPDDPHAIRDGEDKGYVRLSNVNYHTEMMNALVAARAYEANVTVLEAAKSMATTTLRLIA